MKKKILLVNATLRSRVRNHYIHSKCENVVLLEGERKLPELMCKQCGVKEAEVINYEIVKELGKGR